MKNQIKQKEVVVSLELQHLLTDLSILDVETFPMFKDEYKKEIQGHNPRCIFVLALSKVLAINLN